MFKDLTSNENTKVTLRIVCKLVEAKGMLKHARSKMFETNKKSTPESTIENKIIAVYVIVYYLNFLTN